MRNEAHVLRATYCETRRVSRYYAIRNTPCLLFYASRPLSSQALLSNQQILHPRSQSQPASRMAEAEIKDGNLRLVLVV